MERRCLQRVYRTPLPLLPFRNVEVCSTPPQLPYLCLHDDTQEMRYVRERRAALGGSLPARRRTSQPLEVPPLSAFDAQLKGSGDRTISTTMAFVRVLSTLLRDKKIGKRVVPIVPDESRTFGMEGMFRQFGISVRAGSSTSPRTPTS